MTSRSSDLLLSILSADDTSVFIEGKNYDKIIIIVNNELEQINIWLRANKLTVKHKNTLHDISSDKHKPRNITICGMNVTYTKNTKFLGVIIDNKLRWCDLIYYIKNKIDKSIGIIDKTHNFSKKSLLYFYISISYILYRNLGNTNDIHLDPLFKKKKV